VKRTIVFLLIACSLAVGGIGIKGHGGTRQAVEDILESSHVKVLAVEDGPGPTMIKLSAIEADLEDV
jgi:hypothetical protein